jgi:hypothetical protein
MSRYLVNTEERMQELLGDLRELWRMHHYLRLNVKVGKDRNADQNALSHVWYSQIARELREESELDVKRFCKLTMGVPILRAEDDTFRDFYDTAIKPHLSYEQKLKAMDALDVTSKMSVRQMQQYLDAMVENYRARGVTLVSNKPDRYAYRHREAA